MVVSPPYLLGAHERFFVDTQLESGAAFVLNKLVGHVQHRCIRRCSHPGTYTVGIDWRIYARKRRKLKLVQPAAGDDLNLSKAGVIEYPPHLCAACSDIAAINTHCKQTSAHRFEFTRDLNRVRGAPHSVVSINK